MSMLRAGLTAGLMVIGAVSALLGAVIMLSALKTGAINISYGTGANAVAETVTQAADAARYWRLFAGLGVAPLVAGSVAAWWGWRTISR